MRSGTRVEAGVDPLTVTLSDPAPSVPGSAGLEDLVLKAGTLRPGDTERVS